ncbi:DUF771 domain-containing protein [Lactobacillus terrae]|uniref:DUF771 domain-containing protein n=1 Tax=Lactobacillus terrae TaxID=2269374 RepID=UPI000C1B7A58|nr:DUF771 domain-containing protein [Lactobacillus terrae]
MQANLNLDDEYFKAIVNEEISKAMKQLVTYPAVLTKEKAIEYSGFGEKRLMKTFRTFKDELDVENGGCIYYPTEGQGYKINRKGFDEFLEKHMLEIIDMKVN